MRPGRGRSIQPCPVRDEYGPAGQAVFGQPEAAPRPTQRMRLLWPLRLNTHVYCTRGSRGPKVNRKCKFAVSFCCTGHL